jgi:hypothetical protein
VRGDREKTSPGNPKGGRQTWSNGYVPVPPGKGDNDPVLLSVGKKRESDKSLKIRFLLIPRLCRNHWKIVLALLWAAATFASAPAAGESQKKR